MNINSSFQTPCNIILNTSNKSVNKSSIYKNNRADKDSGLSGLSSPPIGSPTNTSSFVGLLNNK